jgi:hypothetical protein
VLTINQDSTQPYLNGGMTIYDNNSRSYIIANGATLNIGSGGAFFSADGSGSGLFTLTIAQVSSGTGAINVAAGANLTIGSPKIDFQDKNGHVQFDAPFNNPINSITKITSGDFILNNASPAVAGKLVTGDIIATALAATQFGNNNFPARAAGGHGGQQHPENDPVKSDINIDGTPFTTTTRGTVLRSLRSMAIPTPTVASLGESPGHRAYRHDLANIFMNAGGVPTVDEDNTDVRASLRWLAIRRYPVLQPTGGAKLPTGRPDQCRQRGGNSSRAVAGTGHRYLQRRQH